VGAARPLEDDDVTTEQEVPAGDAAEPGDSVPSPEIPQPSRPKRGGGFRRALGDLALAAVAVLLVFAGTRSVAQGREVLGPSMQPTFEQGQRIFVAKYLLHDPGRGDVVVFKPPVASKDDFIKRVIGVPGDHVVIRNGSVTVNGEPLSEAYIHGAATLCNGRFCDVTLGLDQYYVMGDNRPNSSDSRSWGPVTRSNIRGQVWLRFYPLGDFKLEP